MWKKKYKFLGFIQKKNVSLIGKITLISIGSLFSAFYIN